MARKPTRIAPPSMIADALASLLAQIERNPKLSEKQRELAYNAAVKAFNQLFEGVSFTRNGDEFVFPSRSRSGIAHHINGACDCEAGEEGDPCWHRAAKREILMVEEAQQADASLPPDAEGLHMCPDAPPLNCDPAFITCPSCGGPMHWAVTPGREECIECFNPRCGRTIHADVVAVFFA